MKMIPISRITCLYLKKNGCTVYGVNIEKKDRSVSTYSFDKNSVTMLHASRLYRKDICIESSWKPSWKRL